MRKIVSPECFAKMTKILKSHFFQEYTITISSQTMSEFTDQLLTRTSGSLIPFLLDGALGSLLPTESQEHALWSTHTVIANPSIVKQIHKDYITNGSDIILTSTYQTSEAGVKKWFPDLKYEDVVKKSIDIAYDAVVETGKSGKVFIAGSIGPFGASLANGAEYTGQYGDISKEDIQLFHEKRLKLLIEDSRVDLIAIETIPNLLEIEALLDLAGVGSKPFYLSMSVKGRTLADGTELEQLLPVFQNVNNLVAVGVNCLGLEDSLTWLNLLKPLSKKLVVYPNSGELWDASLRTFVGNPNGTISWKAYIEKLEEIGDVLIVGGCCRTTPSDIHEMRGLLYRLK